MNLSILRNKIFHQFFISVADVVTHKTPHEYKQAVAYMLAQDYGFTRVMSSYFFDSDDQGPPHNGDFT